MAIPSSIQDCHRRHIDYPFDISERLDNDQLDRVVAMCNHIPYGYSVLDVGCNSGYIADFLDGREVEGVDISPGLVQEANKRIKAQVASAECLPYPDSQFDVVVLGEILEHVFNPSQVLKEAERVASHLIVGSTPHERSQWGKHTVETHPFHVRCFSRDELMEALEPFGQVTIETVAQFYIFEVQL